MATKQSATRKPCGRSAGKRRTVAGNAARSETARIAFFPQDLIGDALTWANLPAAAKKLFAPCEVTVFCTKGVAELFGCMAFCDRVVEYDPARPWSAEEARSFGHFDLVVNTRYDADSAARVEALDHDEACGFENVDIPEAICKRIYDRYVPLSRWDDFHLRRETSVTEQGAELVRLFAPDYHCRFVELGKTEFEREPPEPSDAPRIVFVLGASDPAKSWGVANYLELARRMRTRGFAPLFLLGPKEEALAPRIGAAGFDFRLNEPFRRIAGLFDLDYGTACVVGNDTGLMHLACMLGAPSVTIMPHGHHFTWFPYAADERARHVCLAPSCATPTCAGECGETAKCAGKIQVEQVDAAIEEVVK